MSDSVFIIAEAGVNHNGEMGLAKKLVDVAVEAEADAVKFQAFSAEKLTTSEADLADYQSKQTGDETQQELLRRLELSRSDQKELNKYCSKQQIEFLCSPFDRETLDFLVNQLKVRKIKIPSGEITNAPLLRDAGRSGKPVILSTGMSTIEEIRTALSVLSFGFVRESNPDSAEDFREYLTESEARDYLKNHVRLLHCVSEYPAPIAEVNLKAMDTISEEFGLPVGFSDHTLGINIALAAVGRGARVIEKHFTLDRDMEGPDHQASLSPEQLSEMIKGIREIEPALGDGHKRPSPSEQKNKQVVRKSLVAKTEIKSGEQFTDENLTTKRPGGGLTPLRYWEFLGKKADRNYRAGEPIR